MKMMAFVVSALLLTCVACSRDRNEGTARAQQAPAGQKAAAAQQAPRDNTAVNVRDRGGDTLTAQNQSENPADRTVSEWTDATGSISLIERELPDAWAGRKLLELDEGERFRLVALTRAGQARLVAPSLVGQEGDILHLAVRTDAVEELRARLGDASKGAHT